MMARLKWKTPSSLPFKINSHANMNHTTIQQLRDFRLVYFILLLVIVSVLPIPVT